MKDISSTASFVDFTLENFIYVDKTEYIPKLVKQKRVFISLHVVLVNLLPQIPQQLYLKQVQSLTLKEPGFMTSGQNLPILY